MGAKIRDIDRGAEALLERLANSLEGSLTIGLHESEGSAGYDGGLTVLDVGTLHEFGGTDENGNPSPPRRSFIGDWIDSTTQKRKANLRTVALGIVTGKVKSLDQGLSLLGAIFVGEVQKRISDGIPPPLADSTVARKGSSVPLIDTGQLRSSITFKTEKV